MFQSARVQRLRGRKADDDLEFVKKANVASKDPSPASSSNSVIIESGSEPTDSVSKSSSVASVEEEDIEERIKGRAMSEFSVKFGTFQIIFEEFSCFCFHTTFNRKLS